MSMITISTHLHTSLGNAYKVLAPSLASSIAYTCSIHCIIHSTLLTNSKSLCHVLHQNFKIMFNIVHYNVDFIHVAAYDYFLRKQNNKRYSISILRHVHSCTTGTSICFTSNAGWQTTTKHVCIH